MPAFLKKISSTALRIVLSFCFSFSLVAVLMSAAREKACPLTLNILNGAYYASSRCLELSKMMYLQATILFILVLFVLHFLRRKSSLKDIYKGTLILLTLMTLGLLLYTGYKSAVRSMKYQKTVLVTKHQPSTTPIPTPTTKLVDIKELGLKTYHGSIYSISFPKDWTFSGPRSGLMNFPEIISISSPTTSTTLLIGVEGDFRAGWGNSDNDPRVFKQEDLTVTVGDHTVIGRKQSITGPTGPLDPEISTTTFVSITPNEYQYPAKDGIENQNQPMKLYPLTFWYGNSYPTTSPETTPQQAMIDFEKEEPIVKEILESFKFHPAQKIKADGVDYEYLTDIPSPELKTTLDLSRKGLYTLPFELPRFKNIKNLYLSQNNIESIPDTILYLKNLELLNLTGNPISKEELQRIQQLLPNTQILLIQPMNINNITN